MKSIHDPRYLHLIEMLIEAREEAEITQTALAHALGKHQSYIAKVENMDRRIDIVELADWLRAIRLEPQEFVTQLAWWK